MFVPKRSDEDAAEFKRTVEDVEVRINRHSPMPNFEIKELCAREIVMEVLEPLVAEATSRAENAMLEKCTELARKYMGHIPDGEVTSVDDFFTKLQSLRKV